MGLIAVNRILALGFMVDKASQLSDGLHFALSHERYGFHPNCGFAISGWVSLCARLFWWWYVAFMPKHTEGVRFRSL